MAILKSGFSFSGTVAEKLTIPYTSPSAGPQEITSPLFKSMEPRVKGSMVFLSLQELMNGEIRMLKRLAKMILFMCGN